MFIDLQYKFSSLRALIDYSEPLGCFRPSKAKVRNVWRPRARLVPIATFVMSPRFGFAFIIWGAFGRVGGTWFVLLELCHVVIG